MSEQKTWAIALVDDHTPANLEYGDYRGYVLLCDDLWETNVPSVEEGVAAYASRTGVSPETVTQSPFQHDQYSWYRILSS